MIPFPFNENQFSFFVADHLLVGQLCTNPKSDRSLLSCLKCSTSEIKDAPLYNSYTLLIQVIQNANPDGSMFEGTGQRIRRPFERGGEKGHCQELIEKVPAIIDETPQWPIQQIARDLGISHTTVNACVKEDLKCRFYRRQTSQILTKKLKNLRLIKSVRPRSSPDLNPLDYFIWSYVENITNMTSHSTKASLITTIRRVFTELPPALVKKACFQFRIKAVIEAESGYIEKMSALLHNQVTWIDFFNKSFKIKL